MLLSLLSGFIIIRKRDKTQRQEAEKWARFPTVRQICHVVKQILQNRFQIAKISPDPAWLSSRLWYHEINDFV